MQTMFSRLAFAAAATVLVALAAQPVRSETAKPSWTGCYGGAAAGLSSTVTKAEADVVGVGNLLAIDGLGSDGPALTLIAGCDVQIDRFVIGAFGDYTWHHQKWEASSGLLPGTLASLDVSSQWTIGGRAGITVGNALVYGLLGYTVLNTSDISVPPLATSFAVSDFKGVAVGGGVDIALGSGFFLGAEYRYQMFDTQSVALVPGVLNLNLEPDMHTVQGRLTYRFGPGVLGGMK